MFPKYLWIFLLTGIISLAACSQAAPTATSLTKITTVVSTSTPTPPPSPTTNITTTTVPPPSPMPIDSNSDDSESVREFPTPTIGGIISGTLGQEGWYNVYYVNNDLEVPAGQVLTITADTSLDFEPGRGMNIAGRLIAEGGIRFLSSDEAGWSGLHFQPSAKGSRCIGCSLENVETGGVALQVEAPITFKNSRIRGVPGGTAISTTTPLTLTNLWIDYVGTGFQVSGPFSATHHISYITLSRCQHGVINQGQILNLDNSILTVCDVAVSTELSGTTAISYSLIHANFEDFITEAGAQLVQGPGLLTEAPRFTDFPDNIHLRPDSPAVNAADPQADYSYEPGYNGGRADLGFYGNTQDATEQPPLEQMAVTLKPISPVEREGWPGQTITYTLTVENRGSMTDTYMVTVNGANGYLPTSLYWAEGYESAKFIQDLEPQGQVPITVWVTIPSERFGTLSDTITVNVNGDYHAQDEIVLTTTVVLFQEAGGQTVLEAEHFAQNRRWGTSEWQIQTALVGYTDSGYVYAVPDIDQPDTDRQFNVTDDSPRLFYPINFTTSGTYTLWLRGYAPNTAGDSLYMAMANQNAITVTGFTPSEWSWTNRNDSGDVATIVITEPGIHTLHLWQREDGLSLDKIVLTTDGSYTPTNDGPPQSEIR